LAEVDEPMSNPVVLVYSNRPEVREAVMLAIGRRPAPDVGRIDFLECGTFAEVLMAVDAGEADLVVLDAEAQPVGGMGISRQMHMELDNVPPVVMLIRRQDDRWLATWARADELLMYPLDPVQAADTVAAVLRRRRAVAVPHGAAR
jgi:DNA-binding response OmpR family regulator